MSPNGWFSQPAYIPSGNPETMSEANLDKAGQLGITFSINNPPRSAPDQTTGAGTPKAYKIIRTDSSMGVAPYAGAVAWWANRASYTVTTSPTALGRGHVAGVFRRAWNKAGDYMAIQVKGLGTVKMVDGTVMTGAGQNVIPSATAGKADIMAAGTAATYPVMGRSAGVSDAAAMLMLVDLDVPDTL